MNSQFSELTDIEKSSLFIAWTEGKVIQYRGHALNGWSDVKGSPSWFNNYGYRVKPEEPINTIDWSLIHPDYNHLAKDDNGEWWLYIDTPRPERNRWEGNTRIRRFPLDALTFFNPKEVYWMNSLISRPNIKESDL